MDRRHLLKLLGTATAFAGWTPLQLEALLKPGGTRSIDVAFFTDAQREAVTAFCDLIIPTTDTPGAVETGVVEYIELMVSEWFDDGERERFMRGLTHFEEHTQSMTGTSFALAPEVRQVAILKGLEAEANSLRDADPDAEEEFFHQARGLVLHGYYTSEVGMKDEQMFIERPMFY
ncbi:MAG: gluconate 2-dehydrogenase subunit 3 family protein [Gemmatimonadetes bacterium]|nr:gluconate 2-dehydrogenase subunit 3 family protein [Gemmatimonadota bacterium]